MTRHHFAPGAIEHHKRRHMRSLARWFGRVLALLMFMAIAAAAIKLFWVG